VPDPTVVSIATQQHEPTSVVVQGSSQGALTQGDNAGCMQTTTHGTVMNNVCGFQLFLPLVNTPPPPVTAHSPGCAALDLRVRQHRRAHVHPGQPKVG
jgi:hypothetical protein